MAKDVSGFANVGGGILILGAKTRRDPSHFGDEIETFRPFKRTLLNENQYRKVIQDWIYPDVNVQFSWFPDPKEPERGIAALLVPEQDGRSTPFLVTRVLLETSEQTDNREGVPKLHERVVGLFERRLDSVEATAVWDIHRLIVDGRRFQDVLNRLEALQVSVDDLHPLRPPSEDSFGGRIDTSARLREALERTDLAESPAFTLCVIPSQPSSIPAFFQGPSSPLWGLLKTPPRLRPAGFGFYGGDPKIIAGRFLQAGRTFLWRDGFLITVFAADRSHLCWPEGHFINRRCLAESTYLFVQLAQLVLGGIDPRPNEIEFQVGASHC